MFSNVICIHSNFTIHILPFFNISTFKRKTTYTMCSWVLCWGTAQLTFLQHNYTHNHFKSTFIYNDNKLIFLHTSLQTQSPTELRAINHFKQDRFTLFSTRRRQDRYWPQNTLPFECKRTGCTVKTGGQVINTACCCLLLREDLDWRATAAAVVEVAFEGQHAETVYSMCVCVCVRWPQTSTVTLTIWRDV